MGMEVFLFSPKMSSETKNEYWDHDAVRKILARDAKNPGCLEFVEYPDGGGAGEVSGIDKEDREGLMFAHFGGPTFMARIFEIAHLTRSLIYWTDGPTEPNYGVTHAETVALVPRDFADGVPPHVIRDLEHMADLIGRHKLTPMTYIHCV